MLANGKHHPIIRRVCAAEHWQLAKAVTLTRTEDKAGSNQLINDGNHQPIIRYSGLVHLRAKLVPTLGDLLQCACAYIQHVNRAVWNCDEQVSSACEQPNSELGRQQKAPLLKQRLPIQTGLVNQVVVNVHGVVRSGRSV
jgi:hypothetical protein